MSIIKRIIALIIVVYGCTGAELAKQTSITPGTKTCRAPSQPQNGHWKLHRSQCESRQECDIPEGTELPAGSHLIYSCNPGSKIRGSSDVSCSFEGEWLNVPVCTEIRCKPLSTVSTEARCSYLDEWVSCDSPVLPKTRARLSCRNSYRRESSLLSRQRENVRCGENGQWEPEPIRCVPDCGVLPLSLTPLILNGTTSNVIIPWHASIYYGEPNKPKRYYCGATIIQENLLITAAHCVYDENTQQAIDANNFHILAGNIFRDYDSLFHDLRIVRKSKVKNIYIRCDYQGLRGNYMSDIAILELIEPFVLSPSVVPICIDHPNNSSVLEAGMYGRVANFGESSSILQSLSKPYIPLNECKSAGQSTNTEQLITNDKFCAGYRNGSFCEGSSGNGLVFQTDGLWYLRGITSVSLSIEIREGIPSCNSYILYTRVSNYIGWIQDVVGILEQNLPIEQC